MRVAHRRPGVNAYEATWIFAMLPEGRSMELRRGSHAGLSVAAIDELRFQAVEDGSEAELEAILG